MNEQMTLFDLEAVAPTKGEIRAQRAAERREERRERSQRYQEKMRRKRDEKRAKELRFPARSCCGYYYSAGSGWTSCHGCKSPLYDR